MSDNTVRRLLVTGDRQQLQDLATAVSQFATLRFRRKRTILFICPDESFDLFVEIGRDLGVTIQEVKGAEDDQSIELVIGDDSQARKHGDQSP